jgi:hypothetical protein
MKRGIAEIRLSKSGEYYLRIKSRNGKIIAHTECVKRKSHIINIANRYFPAISWHLKDLTHLKPERIKYNIILS